MIEYAVMKKVGVSDPEVFEAGFETFERADRACSKAWNSIDYRDVTVSSALEARRIAIEMETAAITQFYVAKRPVGKWEVCWE